MHRNFSDHSIRCSLAGLFRRFADRLSPESDLVQRVKPFVGRS